MQRLKTRNQFQAVLAGGTVARTPHFALHRAGLDAAIHDSSASEPFASPSMTLFPMRDVWVGALVPKRWARRAVTRNTIKRQIYSVSADFEAAFVQAAQVVRLRTTFDRKLFTSATSELLKAAVRSELQQLFARATPGRPAPSVGTGAS